MGGADFRKNFEAVFTEPLKAIRRRARLVSAAAKKTRAGFLDALGDGQTLLFGFHGARAGHEGDVLAPNDNLAGGSGDAKDGVFLLRVAADKLVGLADWNAFHNAGQRFQDAKIDLAFVAGDADSRSNGPGNRVSL